MREVWISTSRLPAIRPEATPAINDRRRYSSSKEVTDKAVLTPAGVPFERVLESLLIHGKQRQKEEK